VHNRDRDEPLAGTSVVKEYAVSEVRGPLTRTGVSDLIVRLRRRLAELESWQDGSVKAVAQEAVRAEITRLGRELTELEWRWA
jgi:hypothetical protein